MIRCIYFTVHGQRHCSRAVNQSDSSDDIGSRTTQTQTRTVTSTAFIPLQTRTVTSTAIIQPTQPSNPCQKFLEHPHACLTLSEAATWGSTDLSEITETDVPSSERDDFVDTSDDFDEDTILDDEWVVHGGSHAPLSAPSVDEELPIALPEQDLDANLPGPTDAVGELTKGDLDEGAADDEAVAVEAVKLTRREKRKRRSAGHRSIVIKEDYAAAATGRPAAVNQATTQHVDVVNKDAMQKLVSEESGKRLVITKEVTASTGAVQEQWKLAAESGLPTTF